SSIPWLARSARRPAHGAEPYENVSNSILARTEFRARKKKSLIFFALAFPAPAAATLGRAPSPGDAGTRHGLNSSVTWSTMRPRVGEGRRDCPSTSPAGRPPDDGGPRRGGVRAGG